MWRVEKHPKWGGKYKKECIKEPPAVQFCSELEGGDRLEREGGASSYEIYPEGSGGSEAREVGVRVVSFTPQPCRGRM